MDEDGSGSLTLKEFVTLCFPHEQTDDLPSVEEPQGRKNDSGYNVQVALKQLERKQDSAIEAQEAQA
eukprot:5318520-Prymnesium_polylepis.1